MALTNTEVAEASSEFLYDTGWQIEEGTAIAQIVDVYTNNNNYPVMCQLLAVGNVSFNISSCRMDIVNSVGSVIANISTTYYTAFATAPTNTVENYIVSGTSYYSRLTWCNQDTSKYFIIPPGNSVQFNKTTSFTTVQALHYRFTVEALDLSKYDKSVGA